MLKIKVMLCIQDESHDDTGYHVTPIYDRKAKTLFLPNPMENADQCVKRNIRETLSRLIDDVDTTLNVESTNIEYFYAKNMTFGMWRNGDNDAENHDSR